MTVIQYFGLYGCYIVVSVVCLEGLFVVIIYIYVYIITTNSIYILGT